MKKNLLIMFAALTVACTDRPTDDLAGDLPMAFAPKVHNTKTSITTISNLSGFGVAAYYTGSKAWAEAKSTTTANYMSNQEVTKSGDSWIYSPPKYWPLSSNEKITFCAYAPYSNSSTNGITFRTSSPGAPTLTYEIPTTASDRVDLLAADTVDCTRTTSSLKFNFKHILSRVNISVLNTLNLVEITSITLKGINTIGTYQYESKTWDFPESTTSDLTTPINQQLKLGEYVLICDPNNYLMMIPQSIEGIKLVFSYKTVLGKIITGTTEVTLPTSEWVMGGAINYKIPLPISIL